MKALIFDFDGTILDTETAEFTAWQSVFHANGAELALEYWLPCIGTNDVPFEPSKHLEQLVGRPLDHEALEQQVKDHKTQAIAQLSPLPGVLDFLEAAPKLGVKLAVASSSRLAWVEGHLRRLGLWEYFEVVRTKENVERTKPDPALFLKAAEALGLHPSQTIVIEDSLNGVKAGKAAGAYTVAVPNSITRHLDLSRADLLLECLCDLSLENLLAQARSSQQLSQTTRR